MKKHRFSGDDLLRDPIAQFLRWYAEACAADVPGSEVPASMAFATASKSGKVSVRFVLLKEIDDRGLLFFTDYSSPKGRDLAVNPQAAASFYWPELHRQVRIKGRVEKLSAARSDAYFTSRPRLSRIATIASRQSRIIPFTMDLKKVCDRIARARRGRPIMRPGNWGGYRIVPSVIEFWQAGSYRLHDRFVYKKKSAEKWNLHRLSP
jgi:pyridoxamine 5'-phosphate oxidase